MDVKVDFKLSGLSVLCIVVQIVFLVLRLCGAIAWPWVFVLIPAMVFGGLVAVDLIALLIAYVLYVWRNR